MPAQLTVGAVPAAVFTPNPSSKSPSVVVFNAGPQPVYLGSSSVTAATGLLLNANAEVSFPFFNATMYAVAAPGAAGTATTLSASIAAGGTSVTMTSATGFGTASTVLVGTSGAAEALVVSTVTGGTAVTFTSGARFAHLSGEAASLVDAPLTSTLTVSALATWPGVAVNFSQYAVGTVPTLILANGIQAQGASIVFTNPSSTNVIYIGSGTSVTVSNGAPVPPYAVVSMQNVGSTTPVYAIAGTALTLGVFYGDLR